MRGRDAAEVVVQPVGALRTCAYRGSRQSPRVKREALEHTVITHNTENVRSNLPISGTLCGSQRRPSMCAHSVALTPLDPVLALSIISLAQAIIAADKTLPYLLSLTGYSRQTRKAIHFTRTKFKLLLCARSLLVHTYLSMTADQHDTASASGFVASTR